jgi:hypothetical protein
MKNLAEFLRQCDQVKAGALDEHGAETLALVKKQLAEALGRVHQQIVKLSELPPDEVQPTARCKWCIERIGGERYRFLGAWHNGLCVPLTHCDFTDTICPECEEKFFPDDAYAN